MTHPLDLAEIRTLIGLFLDFKDLYLCIQVCRTWNDSFTSILYRRCAIISYNAKNPSIYAINKHADSVRSLSIIGEIDPSYYSIECSYIRYLSIFSGVSRQQHHPQLSPVVVDLVNRNSSALKAFKLTQQPNTMSTALWNSLAQCNALTYLYLRHNTISSHDMKAFWEACSNIDRLTLDEVNFEVDPVSEAATFLPTVFQSLKKLKLESIGGLSDLNQLGIIRRAPNLNDLIWQPQSRNFPLDEYRQVMSSQIFMKLQFLKIYHRDLSDEDIAITLDAMTEAKDLQLCGHFSMNSYQSLMTNHAETIHSLDIRYCSSTSSDMVQGILSGCPLLEYFMADVIKGIDLVRIESTDLSNIENSSVDEILVLGKDWVCRKLKFLAVFFDMSCDVSANNQITAKDEVRLRRRQQLEQEIAFRQISRLTELRTLDFSEHARRDVTAESLRLRLRSRGGELDQLATLKNLEWIQFERTSQEFSEDELDWMVEHWPKLTGVYGTLHADDARNHQLKTYRNAKLIKAKRSSTE